MRAWTPEQQEAINLRHLNLLVAAAAGSGKTAVLVERVIQLMLQDGVDIDQMLVVTFTKAAASEMRERISHALLEALHQPGPHVQHIRRQLTRMNRSYISTLHSFCTEVIRRYYQLAQVDPAFKVADQNEAELMRLAAAETVLETSYEGGRPEFLGLVEMFSPGKSDQAFRDLLLQMYDFMQSQPQPWSWLEEHLHSYSLDRDALAAGVWVESLMDSARVQINAARERFAEAIKVCRLPGGPEPYITALEQDFANAAALMEAAACGADDLYQAVRAVSYARLRAVRGGDEDLKATAKTLREEGKNIIKALQKGVCSKNLAEWSQELNQLHPHLRQLYDLLQALAAEYGSRKTEKGVLDFNDLEHLALHILQDPQAANEYRQRFEYIFVDEYQDSNLVQEALLNCIARPDNLFMVGDVKQSIYRFRLADPGLFLEKYRLYRDEHVIGCSRIDLKINFRSQPGIIAVVNHVFAHIMNRHVGELEYSEEAFLHNGVCVPEEAAAPVTVALIDDEPGQMQHEGEEDRGRVDREARVVARAIGKMIGQPVYDAVVEGYRPLQYRDVVVLLRATRNWSAEFMEVFAEMGIPAYADVNTGYFGAVEVEVMLNLLKIIDNHYQDIPLLSVLRSPLFGLSSAELIAIRLEKPQGAFYQAFEAYSLRTADPLADKVREIRTKLSVWRREARYLPVDQMIWQLYAQTGYYHYAAALPGGPQRQANLRILAERARQFENTSLRGLYNFIRFVENLLAGNRDLETARILGENDNVVRVMSVHKSKGLEFPVVFVAGLGKSFNLTDSRAPLVLHKQLGLGSRYVNLTSRRRSETIASLAVKERLRLESLAEEMRILYVAMTRAKSRLFLVGTVKNLAGKAASWQRPLGRYELAQAKGIMDWLGPLWLRHPDGQSLRDCLEEPFPHEACPEEVRWQIEVFKSSALIALERQRHNLQEEVLARLAAAREPRTEALPTEIVAQLTWRYPHEGAARLPSKLTVSQLKKVGIEPQAYFSSIPSLNKRPQFMSRQAQGQVQSLTGAQRGIILHYIMQQVDFSNISQAGLQSQLEAMVEAEMLTSLEAASVGLDRIEAFFGSALGQRILQAQRVFREVGFNQLVEAWQVLPDAAAAEEKLLLQGVIDLYFEEPDGLVVVDYKTDRVTPDNRQNLIAQYQIQVQAYCRALQAISGQPVKQGYIYFLAGGEAVEVMNRTP